jgi:hypothetical protein
VSFAHDRQYSQNFSQRILATFIANLVKALPSIYICEKKKKKKKGGGGGGEEVKKEKTPYLSSWFPKDSDLACMI